jgi:hypothetical protein
VSVVVNLRQARKAQARARAKTGAAGSAAQHGRTRGEKARQAADRARAVAHLDGRRREPAGGDPD